MSSDIENKRRAVALAYSSNAWLDRVNKMSDEQIIAIYLRLKAQKKI